jgi:simple sugar transport system permease protein
MAGIPIDIISIIQGLIIIFIAAPDIIRWLYRLKEIKVEETVLTRGWGS